jgi:hypothetical protein
MSSRTATDDTLPGWEITVRAAAPYRGPSDIPKELINAPLHTFCNNHQTQCSIFAQGNQP